MLPEKPKHIFLVEDNELYAMMLDYILSKDSIYKFMNFTSGEECIKNLYLKPDVVILDYGLPGMNGYDTLVEIKKHNPLIQVVMLSNNTDTNLAVKLLKAGADDFVLKQEHGETQLIEKIESILNRGPKKSTNEGVKTKSLTEKMFYLLLILIALSFGYFYLHK